MDNIRLFIAAYMLLLFLLLNGCISERLDMDEESEDGNATLYLSLDIPGLNSGLNSGQNSDHNSVNKYNINSVSGYHPGTVHNSEPELRAMSAVNESSIDYDNIHILVFEEVEQDELFRYKAVISAVTPQQLTLKIPVSRANERYRFVAVVNAGVPYIADGTPKNEALNQMVFDCVGKWNTSDASFTHIPMWGEHKQPFAIKNNTSINIIMHRALARVDVGALFKFNNPNPITGQEYDGRDTDKESVWGLDNFKIKEIRVYRTVNKGFIASSADKMVANEVVTPNIPASAKYNSNSGTRFGDLYSADKNPLVYTLSAASDSYIREIYIPESFMPAVSVVVFDGSSFGGSSDASQFANPEPDAGQSGGSSVDLLDLNLSDGSSFAGSPYADPFVNLSYAAATVPCIVIGGYYGEDNTTNITYYRADFATYSNGKILAYRFLLRNHRYVFDIRRVGGPGYNEPEQALNAVTSDMVFDIKEWNEQSFNYQVRGNYFCSIDTREVTLDARPAEGEAAASGTISYRTNLDLDPITNPFAYKWKSSGNADSDDFDIVFDYQEKTIKIKAKNNNVGIGAQPISAQVYISVKNYQFSIDVKQKAINANYMPDCSGALVHGIYRADFALNYTNYITVRLTSPTTLRGLGYDISTAETNGIYFAAKGAFDTDGTYANGLYEYELNLKGYGTLINETGFLSSFDIMIIFNSITPTTCSVAVQVD